MITTKQRAKLRALANPLEPSMQIGKDGISDNSIIQVKQMLDAKELIKIKVLETCDLTAREISNKLVEETGCDAVQTIGKMVVLYRKSRQNIRHIELF